MFFRILKKDLRRKKGIHAILLFFIIIATIFLASSVNNILVVTQATDYYLDKANVPDFYVFALDEPGADPIEKWLKEDSKYADNYEIDDAMLLARKNLEIQKDGKISEYNMGQTIMLQTQPSNYNQVFNEQGDKPDIKPGEVGMSFGEMERNGLQIGDSVLINIGNDKKSLQITTVIKDAALGGDFTGIKRFILNDIDYDYFSQNEDAVAYSNYYIDSSNLEKLQTEYRRAQLNAFLAADKGMFQMGYVMNMIMAGILIVVGICLILIAFLVLRFTIVFTIQEDYREIGIMKAIGIKNNGIKQLYLVKYFVIVTIGSIIGCIISFPVSKMMIGRVSTNMLMQDSMGKWISNIGCSFLIVITVLVLSYISTRKLNKYSVITAIRKGSIGERYKKKIYGIFKSKENWQCLYSWPGMIYLEM